MSLRLLSTTLLIALPGLALAQEDRFSTHFLAKNDLNKDGVITVEEVLKRRGKGFQRHDIDADGALTPKEYEAITAHHRHQEETHQALGFDSSSRRTHYAMAMAVTDKDGDGRTTKEEFLAATAAWFASVDADGDGKLTAAELDAW